jgi:hypothetical protein
MSASAPFGDVEKMLKKCAPGYDLRPSTHSRVITFNGRVFRELPGQKHSTIELGHIRKMIRFLGISVDCANKWVPALKMKPDSPAPKDPISTNT